MSFSKCKLCLLGNQVIPSYFFPSFFDSPTEVCLQHVSFTGKSEIQQSSHMESGASSLWLSLLSDLAFVFEQLWLLLNTVLYFFSLKILPFIIVLNTIFLLQRFSLKLKASKQQLSYPKPLSSFSICNP